MSFDGFWFKVGQQAIHCLKLDNPDPVAGRPEHGGRDRHVCLVCGDINALIDRLEQHYIDYTRSKSGRLAIFFRDPDGNAIEATQRDGAAAADK
jgi:glyoxylase I family protein